MTPRARLAGEHYADFSKQFSIMDSILQRAANTSVYAQFGVNAVTNPNNVEVVPSALNLDPFFIVRTWHAISPEVPAKIQEHDFACTLDTSEPVSYLLTESNYAFALSSQQSLLMQRIARRAITQSTFLHPSHIYLGEN